MPTLSGPARSTDIPLAGLAGQDCRGGFARQVTVPANLDLAGNADDTDPAAFTDRQAIADTKLRRVIAGGGTEARKSAPSGEECLEGLVETAQHLLFGREGPPREFWYGTPNGLQLCGLHVVAEGYLPPLPRVNALLQAAIVEAAKVCKHVGNRHLMARLWKAGSACHNPLHAP